jgi:hypothetical protein
MPKYFYAFSRVQFFNVFLKCASYTHFALDPTFFKTYSCTLFKSKIHINVSIICFHNFYLVL